MNAPKLNTCLLKENAKQPCQDRIHDIHVTGKTIEDAPKWRCVEEAHWLAKNAIQHAVVEMSGCREHTQFDCSHEKQHCRCCKIPEIGN